MSPEGWYAAGIVTVALLVWGFCLWIGKDL